MTVDRHSNSARTLLLPCALTLMILPAILPAQNVGFVEHLAPSLASPSSITRGPDGALWSSGTTIVRTTTAGVNTQYFTPTDTLTPSITTGSDGALWFTESVGNIGRITTAGVVTEFPIPAPVAFPQVIASGSDGALWFVGWGNSIGRVTTTGVFTNYPIPTLNSLPQWITAGPDGALWFTELTTDKIGRITTAGAITEFAVPTGTAPEAITTGPDGALWFTAEVPSVGRMTTAGVATLYPVYKRAALRQITSGPDGALWFTDESNSTVGRITTSGAVTEYATPTRSYNVDGITTGPDNAIWFTEFQTENSSKLGQAVLQTATLSATPDTGVPGLEITLSGGGFAPNETINLYSDSTGANLFSTALADSTGSFVVSQSARQSPYGANSIVGVGQASSKIAIAPFSTMAHLSANPTTASVGTTITLEGVGFTPPYGAPIFSGLGTEILGFATPNAQGTFAQSSAFTFTIPAGTPPGPFNVIAGASFGVFVGAVITIQ